MISHSLISANANAQIKNNTEPPTDKLVVQTRDKLTSAMGRQAALGAVSDAGRALFAGGSPSLSDGGAAVELRAHDALHLVDARVVGTGEEAGTLAVICVQVGVGGVEG